MKYITTIALALAFSVSMAVAGEKTLTGKVVCAKCTAKSAEKCSPAFVFKGKDGKEITLHVTGKAAKAIKHGRICKPNTSVEVTITGTVNKEGTITAAKLTEKKK